MTMWICQPRDTLVIRDGRPMADGAGVAVSLDQPWPTTIAGLCRTRIGLQQGGGVFKLSRGEALAIEARGPWWVTLNARGEEQELWVPAPADAVWHRTSQGAADLTRTRLVLAGADPAMDSNLPAGLQFVLPAAELPEGKGVAGPALWKWSAMRNWLVAPASQSAIQPESVGMGRPLHEARIHVGIDAQTQTADDGKLFEIDHVRPQVDFGGRAVDLALAFICDHPDLRPGVVPLGGERRLSSLRQGKIAAPTLDFRPDGRLLRVVLLTPGLFGKGYRPDVGGLGDGVRVVAAAVGRPMTVSGWDFERKAPKAARWAAPAGSVYWLEFPDEAAAHKWAQANWWRPISDDEQDRRDGFGVCAVGVA